MCQPLPNNAFSSIGPFWLIHHHGPHTFNSIKLPFVVQPHRGLEIEAQTESRFIIGSGKPLNESVVTQGPYVLNTSQEILQAKRDFGAGKMGVI